MGDLADTWVVVGLAVEEAVAQVVLVLMFQQPKEVKEAQGHLHLSRAQL